MTEEQIKELQETAKNKIDEATKQLKDDFEAQKKEAQEQKTVIEQLQKGLADAMTVIEEQGKKLKDTFVNTFKSGKAEFAEKFKEAVEAHKGDNKDFKTSISIKSWTSTDTISVDDHTDTGYPANGVSGQLESASGSGHNWKPYFSQFLGFFSKPKPKSRILDLVDVVPLEGYNLVAFVDGVTGDAAVTEECALKPIVKPTLEPVIAQAKTVAAFWKWSYQYLKFFAGLADMFQKKVVELVTDKIPEQVLATIQGGGVAYTGGTMQVPFPTKFDAILAAVVELINKGYSPNGILLNATDYAEMMAMKNLHGTYNLSNNGSINIVNGIFQFNNTSIPYYLEAGMTHGELIVGDFSVVKVGLDGNVDYRTGTNNDGDFRRNLFSNIVETNYADLIVDNAGIIKDTFVNILTDIDDGTKPCGCPETPAG